MTYNPNRDSGYSKAKSTMHIPSADFDSIVQGPEIEQLSARNYAQLVYQVNATPISGEVTVDSVGLDDSGTVKLSGDQLKVYDSEAISALDTITLYQLEDYINNIYSREIQIVSTDTYIAHAEIGSQLSASVWRAQKIDTNGSRTWADSALFTQPATNLSGLTYNY